MARPGRSGRSPAGHNRLPSRTEIVDFVSGSAEPVGRREIARAFGVKGADRMALKKLLREMAADGLFEGRKEIAPSKSLPPVGLADVVAVDADGVVTVLPAGDFKAPAEPIVLSALKGGGLPALGVGDRVLVRFVRVSEGAAPRHEARLIRRLPQRVRRFIAIVDKPRGGRARLTPVGGKGRDDVLLAPGKIEVESGDLVTAELIEGAGRQTRAARVVVRHGNASSPSAVSLIAIHEHGLPHEFSEAALDEAGKAVPPPATGRADLRGLDFITIDPADARDHDDAVHAMPDPNPKNRGGWVVSVAIADVAHFVRPGTALDREALERGNSVYFPDRVVPMLPEALSNELCSLKPGAERPVLVVRMVFDAGGNPRQHGFERATIRSRAALSYGEAQAAFDGNPNDRTAPLADTVLKPLWEAFSALGTARDRRGPLELDLPERRITIDKDGMPVAVVTPPRLDAHRLIEEFMIQANVATAETLEHHRSPFLRRVHEAPAPEKVDALAAFLLSLEMRLPKGQTLMPAHFNRLIRLAAETPHAEAVSDAILRAQAQAHYAPRDVGHFGLNLRRYAHFTSPIRRYADIVAHRALISALHLGPDGLDRGTIAALDEIGMRISDAERRAMAAERDTADRFIAHFLSTRVGALFAGRVRGIVRSGMFVELDDTGASGFVGALRLTRAFGDRYYADEAERALVGAETSAGYRLGDRVEIRLEASDPLRGELDFEMITPPRQLPASTRKDWRKGPRRGGPRRRQR